MSIAGGEAGLKKAGPDLVESDRRLVARRWERKSRPVRNMS